MIKKVIFYKGQIYFSSGGRIPTKLSELTNDVGYITSASIPTNVSAFTNDAGYLTSETDPTVPSWAKASSKPSYTFSEIGSKPTTISGYGITDAKINNGVITLGSNTITPLTSHSNSYGKVNIEFDSGGSSVAYGDSASSNNSNFPNLYFSNNFPASYNSGTRTLTFDGSVYVRKVGDTMSGDLTFKNGTSNDTPDIIFKYGNGNEKMRIWSDNEPTTAVGPNYRIYKSNGTQLYSGRLATLADLNWGNVTGKPVLASAARQVWGSSCSLTAAGNQFLVMTNVDWLFIVWLSSTNNIAVVCVNDGTKAENSNKTTTLKNYTFTRDGNKLTVSRSGNYSISIWGILS